VCRVGRQLEASCINAVRSRLLSAVNGLIVWAIDDHYMGSKGLMKRDGALCVRSRPTNHDIFYSAFTPVHLYSCIFRRLYCQSKITRFVGINYRTRTREGLGKR